MVNFKKRGGQPLPVPVFLPASDEGRFHISSCSLKHKIIATTKKLLTPTPEPTTGCDYLDQLDLSEQTQTREALRRNVCPNMTRNP